MKKKYLIIVFGLFLMITFLSASAQKTYTEGVINFNTTMQGNAIAANTYFNKDSTAMTFSAGPATITTLSNAKGDYMAILINVAVASIKKAAVANPAEIEQINDENPRFDFTPTTEQKQISGFICKKILAKDSRSGKSYDIWITNDIIVPKSAIPIYYQTIGGFPVQYTAFQQGRSTDCMVTSVSGQKAPKGTFSIAEDFDKITMDDLKTLGGGGN